MPIKMDEIILGDALELIRGIPDGSVDLCVMDPPYLYTNGNGAGCFGTKNRKHEQNQVSMFKRNGGKKDGLDLKKTANRNELNGNGITNSFDLSLLDEIDRKLKRTNIYIWCSKAQVKDILAHYESKGCNIDILTWHKTNPLPACCNSYMNDTEYCIFAREPGVELRGGLKTKRNIG